MGALVLLKGPMGVGKSALARALGRNLGWPVVDKDDASDVLIDRLEPHGPAAYALMFAQAASLLEQGFSVIADSPLRGELGLKTGSELAAKAGAGLAVLECICSDRALWRERLEGRTRRAAHVLETWADFEAYWGRAEADFAYGVNCPHLKLDTAEPLAANATRAARWLRQEGLA